MTELHEAPLRLALDRRPAFVRTHRLMDRFPWDAALGRVEKDVRALLPDDEHEWGDDERLRRVLAGAREQLGMILRLPIRFQEALYERIRRTEDRRLVFSIEN